MFLHHFVPRYLVSELFQPYPKGPYMGSLTAFGPGGSAWVSLWDDRARRGLDPVRIRAVKAYDVTLKGEGGFRAFSAIAATLSGHGSRPPAAPVAARHHRPGPPRAVRQ